MPTAPSTGAGGCRGGRGDPKRAPSRSTRGNAAPGNVNEQGQRAQPAQASLLDSSMSQRNLTEESGETGEIEYEASGFLSGIGWKVSVPLI